MIIDARKIAIQIIIALWGIMMSAAVFAQMPNTWYFGQKAGVVFNGGTTISPLTNGLMSTPEGCAVFELTPGIPELYTNGEKAWQFGNVISGFKGSINSCQSALIFKAKKSDTVLFFTTDDYLGNNGLCYNIFKIVKGHLSLAQQNISLLPSATERMCNVVHCDKKSRWVVAHQWNSDAFYAYLINEKGLITDTVISHAGSVHSGNKLNAKGCMKISLDGSKLALAKMGDGTVEVFHFNDVTGKVSDAIMLNGLPNAYGVEFSPSGQVLYVSTASGQLVQFSLAMWNANQIKNSKTLINTQAQLFGSLQLGPDLMIYLARDNAYYLARIELPNSIGPSCIYNPTAVYLAGNKCEAGLPPMVFGRNSVDFKGSIVCLGDTTFFKIIGDTSRIDSVKWYFGQNPVLDSSTLFAPYYIFNNYGTYKTTLVIYHCDTTDTLINFAQIIGPPVANLGPDTSFCSNQPMILDGGGASEYLWDNGSTQQTRAINSPGTYWVRLSNSCGESYDTISVLAIFNPPPVYLPPDTALCSGDSLILDGGSDTSMVYIWQGNDTGRFYVATVNGYYMLDVIDTNGCQSHDGFTLQFDSMPEIDLGPDTTLCIGHELTFNGRAQGYYLWQDGSTDSSYTVTEAGIYYVNVRNACGEVWDSTEVFYEDCEQIIWVPNAFTPNGDHLNDEFLPYVENVSYYHLYIFNRWGELIFETTDYQKGWDGTYRGKDAPQDSYIWRIDYKNLSGKYFNQYGFVILFR
jgi:gliding motility-associated-like protein